MSKPGRWHSPPHRCNDPSLPALLHQWLAHRPPWMRIYQVVPAIYDCTVGSHLLLSADAHIADECSNHGMCVASTSGASSMKLLEFTRLALQLFLVQSFDLHPFQLRNQNGPVLIFIVTTSLCQDWVICAPAAFLGCGSRFSACSVLGGGVGGRRPFSLATESTDEHSGSSPGRRYPASPLPDHLSVGADYISSLQAWRPTAI